MNKKVMLLSIPVLMGIMFMLPLISAAQTTNLVTGGNYSTPMTLTFTVTSLVNNITNVTCYYNASGGATYPANNLSILGSVFNTTAGATSLTGSVATSSLTQSKTYNITCAIFNGSAGTQSYNGSLKVDGVTIDYTVPTNGVSLDRTSISARDSILLNWNYADATSGLYSYSTTITSPDVQACPTITESGASGNDGLVFEQTSCPGTYTVTTGVADYSGNENNITTTFQVSEAGRSKSGSNTGLTGTANIPVSSGAILGDLQGSMSNQTLVILVIIGIGAYLVLKKK